MELTWHLQAQTIYLKDYTPLLLALTQFPLHFDLHDDHTKVTSTIAFARNPQSADNTPQLILNSEDLTLNRLYRWPDSQLRRLRDKWRKQRFTMC